MAHRGHLSRAQLGLRSPRSRSTNITPSKGGCTRHYGGSTLGISLDLSGHARCISVWRGWQNYHMDSHKWADIAYTAGYCQHGYTFAGRGFGVRTAANGTNKGNQSWYAFTFIGGGSDIPSTDALDALDWLVVQARNDGAGNSFNAHSDHKPTACPGNFLRNYTFGNRTGAQKPPSTTPATPPKPAPVRPPVAPKPTPKPPSTSGDVNVAKLPTVSYGDNNRDVGRVQGLLHANGYKQSGIDNDYGPKTRSGLVAFCKAKGLISKGASSTTNISVGPKVWSELLGI